MSFCLYTHVLWGLSSYLLLHVFFFMSSSPCLSFRGFGCQLCLIIVLTCLALFVGSVNSGLFMGFCSWGAVHGILFMECCSWFTFLSGRLSACLLLLPWCWVSTLFNYRAYLPSSLHGVVSMGVCPWGSVHGLHSIWMSVCLRG